MQSPVRYTHMYLLTLILHFKMYFGAITTAIKIYLSPDLSLYFHSLT